MTALALGPQSLQELFQLAEHLSRAEGFVPSAYLGRPPAIAAAILTGAELGLGPMTALRSIHIVEGRPELSAELMLALALRGGVRATWLETTSASARLQLEREGHAPLELGYTWADAERAGLTRRQTYQRHPAAMLRARALSAALRAYCPDLLGPGVYVEGEIDTPDEPTAGPSVTLEAPSPPEPQTWAALPGGPGARTAREMRGDPDVVRQAAEATRRTEAVQAARRAFVAQHGAVLDSVAGPDTEHGWDHVSQWETWVASYYREAWDLGDPTASWVHRRVVRRGQELGVAPDDVADLLDSVVDGSYAEAVERGRDLEAP